MNAVTLAERAISPIEHIIEDARSGRPFILVDAEDRENEGDIIIPAQFATPDQINFMAKHARGLICLALTRERAERLRLPPMASRNGTSLGTAFTVSIEAAEGVSTGISVHDRAHTIAVGVDPTKGPESIVSPGHVFPLVARDGGVLVRAGHTEAAVDISRLAGLNAAGVICEIMNDDGTMARLPELILFAKAHNMRIGTIADLIAYRRRNESLVERVHEMPIESVHGGSFQLIVYRNKIDGIEHIVLLKGQVSETPTLVRMHQVDFATDCLGIAGSREDYIATAIRAVAAYEGAAAVVFIRDVEPRWKSPRYDGNAAETESVETRDYGVGAQILSDLGIHDIVLLSSSSRKLAGLSGYGLKIVEQRPLA